MDCATFLAEYSEFRDGLLPWDRNVDFEAHVDDCESCARYDRVVARGADIFTTLPELEVSDDFEARLQHRIFHVDEERSLAGRRASAGAALATLSVAGLLAAAAWVPLMQREGGRFPAVAAEVSEAMLAAEVAPVSSFADLPEPADGLTGKLQEVGVNVYPLPYRDVLYGASLVSLAGYGGGPYSHDLAR